MKKLIFVVLAVLFMSSPAFLGSAGETSAAEPIKIGAILDFTGPVADLGPKFKAGIELALEEAGYKVAGREIKLIVEDGATDVTVALDKFKKLADKDQVHICIGPLMGDAHLAIAPYAAEKKVIDHLPDQRNVRDDKIQDLSHLPNHGRRADIPIRPVCFSKIGLQDNDYGRCELRR